MHALTKLVVLPLLFLALPLLPPASGPARAQITDDPNPVAGGHQPIFLPALTFTATAVGSPGTSFAFDLAGLDGLYREPVAGDHQPDWAAGGREPDWFRFLQEVVAGGVQPSWLQGAGLIHTMPGPARAPFEIFAAGTIELPVTGTVTEGGQSSAVSGILVIVLEEDLIVPKAGVPLFASCGEGCVSFQLLATFLREVAAGDYQPDFLEGTLFAFEPAGEDLLAGVSSGDFLPLNVSPSQALECFVDGGGTITTGDMFGGSARTSRGHWTNRTPSGDVLNGNVETTDCLADGGGGAGPPQNLINRAFVFGTGTWNGQEGATWSLTLADRGEPNVRDEYGIVVFLGGALVHVSFGLVDDGNLQIHAAP